MPRKETSTFFRVSLSILNTSPRQPLIHFLSVYIFLFWTFYINGAIQYVIFFHQTFSLSIIFLRYCHIHQYFSIFYCWIIFHWLNEILWIIFHKHRFIHPSFDGDLACLDPLDTLNTAALNMLPKRLYNLNEWMMKSMHSIPHVNIRFPRSFTTLKYNIKICHKEQGKECT